LLLFEFHSTAQTGLWKKGGGAKSSIIVQEMQKFSKDVRSISRFTEKQKVFWCVTKARQFYLSLKEYDNV